MSHPWMFSILLSMAVLSLVSGAPGEAVVEALLAFGTLFVPPWRWDRRTVRYCDCEQCRRRRRVPW